MLLEQLVKEVLEKGDYVPHEGTWYYAQDEDGDLYAYSEEPYEIGREGEIMCGS